ncbi:diguanylate cyclase [Gloeocapsa sp. BRSZ]
MRTSEQIKAEIEEKLGFFPPFFKPAQQNPKILENLWQQTCSAYLDNPLPTLFKEKLFAYLSRYCRVPYCIVCHSCSLYALGMNATEVLALLESPLPLAEIEINNHFRVLANATDNLISLSLNSAIKASLIYCSAFVFLGKDVSGYYQTKLGQILGSENYQYLVILIAYIKTCHAWMEAHPKVAYEYAVDKRVQDYLALLLNEEPNLASFFGQYQVQVRCESQNQLEHLTDIAKRNQNEAILRVKAIEVANQELKSEIVDYKQALDALAKTKEALRESEERFRSAFDYAAIGMALVAPNGTWLKVNRAICEIVGYSEQELLATNFQSITHPDDLDVDLHYARQLSSGEIRTCQLEKRYFHKLGHIVWILLSVSLVRDSHGDPLYFIAQIQDITARKQAVDALRESEERWQLALRGNNDGIWDWNVKTNQVFFSARWKEMLGYKEHEIADHLDEWTFRAHPDDIDWVKQVIQDHFAKKTPFYISEHRVLCKDGTYKWILDRGQALWDEAGKPVRMVGSFTDITHRKQAEAALQQANAQLKDSVDYLEQRNREIALFAEMSDIFQACFTVEEACRAIATLMPQLFPKITGAVFLNNAPQNLFTAVTTWGSASLTSHNFFAPDDCWALRRGRSHFVDDTYSGLHCQHINHNLLPAESLCIPMMAQGEALGMLYLSSPESGQLTQVKQQLAIAVAERISLSLANVKLRETLRDQSVRDPLTELFNRRYMVESLELELYRCDRQQQPLAIIMLDIDYFKRFNDTFGHKAGDLVLQKLAQVLQNSIRQSDIACRYGGEEFTLILPETTLEVAYQRAEQLRQEVKQLKVQHDRQLLGEITLSLGIACFPEHGSTPEELLRAADTALYRAKTEARDRVAFVRSPTF